MYKNPFLYQQTNHFKHKTTQKQWCYLSSLIRNSSKILSNNHLPKQYFNYDKLNEDISHMVILWYIRYNSRTKSYGLTMIGFLLAIEDEDNDSIIIDALCCHYMKKSGTLLMTWFIHYCKPYYLKIELYSLLSTLIYYRKFNFIHSYNGAMEDKYISTLYNNIYTIHYLNEETAYNTLKYEKSLMYKDHVSIFNETIKKLPY